MEKSMKDVLIDFFNRNNIIYQKKRFVLAVSTGVDSMALLYAFLELRNEVEISLVVAHVNHHKRRESLEEERYIKEFSKKYDIPCDTTVLDYPIEMTNFQSTARALRYDFFQKVISDHKADYLVLAHHAIDNMETILMRMMRGSNLSGYAGMSEISSLQKTIVLRPFLPILKYQLIEYVNLHKIKYYEDESNEMGLYTRNRVRKEIIPTFFHEDPEVHLKFQEFSEMLRSANDVIVEYKKAFMKENVKGNSLLTENCISFPSKPFLELKLYLQIEIIFALLKEYELSKKAVLEIIKIIHSEKANIESKITENLMILKEYDKISFLKEKKNLQETFLSISEMGTYFVHDNLRINVIKYDSNMVTNPFDLWYNSNMLPIVIRSRRAGDRIKLEFGSKKVKDILIDEKIGLKKRQEVLIVEDKHNQILAILGIKKSILLKELKDADILIKVEEVN